MSERTLQDLQMKQALPLNVKILLTKDRIRQWVNEFGEDGVYVSFSGGKDSTVLLHLVREDYPDIPAVFCDTGLEYPEIREFVKTFDNVTWLKPKMNFKAVIEKYGYPFISKEVSESVYGAKKYLTQIITECSLDRPTDRPYKYYFEKGTGTGFYSNKGVDTEKLKQILAPILNKRMIDKTGGANQRLAIILGMLTNDKINPVQANPQKNRSLFSQEKYSFLLNAPFDISNKCCNVMKKNPAHDYYHKTGKKPITAQMATESKLRTQKWIQNGCNGFNLKIPTSNPMSFWTEQDVLLYIYQNHLPICSVYGDIVKDNEVDGQQDWADLGLFDVGVPVLRTTGCNRTGCMFCGFGCHLEKKGEGRFERMKETHPKQYEWIMKPWDQGGLGYKDIIDYINEHGNLNIRY